jgi:hypothetical protein
MIYMIIYIYIYIYREREREREREGEGGREEGDRRSGRQLLGSHRLCECIPW